MCSYGFSPAINAYRAFGFTCNGNENSLSNCQQTGAVCRTDDVDHALAVECGGSGPRKLMHGIKSMRADWAGGVHALLSIPPRNSFTVYSAIEDSAPVLANPIMYRHSIPAL